MTTWELALYLLCGALIGIAGPLVLSSVGGESAGYDCPEVREILSRMKP